MRTIRQARFLIVVAALIALTACATFGVPTPQTFNERTAAAYQSVTGARNTARILLDAGTISISDAQNVQAQADNLRTAIDVARQIESTTPDGADAKLTATITALNALVAYLEDRQK